MLPQQQQTVQAAQEQQQKLCATHPLSQSVAPTNSRALIVAELLSQHLRSAGFKVVDTRPDSKTIVTAANLGEKLVELSLARRGAVVIDAHPRDRAGICGVSFLFDCSKGDDPQLCVIGRYEVPALGTGSLEFEPCYVAINREPISISEGLPESVLLTLSHAFPPRGQ